MVDALESAARLRLRDVDDPFDPVVNPALTDIALNAVGYTAFDATFQGQNRLIVGYATVAVYTVPNPVPNLPPIVAPIPPPGLPTYIVYPVENGQLGDGEEGPVIGTGEILNYATGSPSPNRPFVAVTIQTASASRVELYSAEDQTPTGTFVFPGTSGNPPIPTLSDFAGNFSDPDGKFLPYAYAAGANGVISLRRLGILRVSEDGELESVIEITLERLGGNVVDLQAPIVMKRDPENRNIYYLLLSVFTFDAEGNALAAALRIYRFNKKTSSLSLYAQVRLPQLGLGYDFNPCLTRVAVITVEIARANRSVARNAAQPLRDVEGKFKELRIYSFSRDSNQQGSLDLVAAVEVSQRGVRVAWNPADSSILAITVRPYSGLTDPATDLPIPFSSPPGTVATLTYDEKEETLAWQDFKPTSPEPFGLTWSPNGNLLAVAGAPSFAQRATQLYRVVDTIQNKK